MLPEYLPPRSSYTFSFICIPIHRTRTLHQSANGAAMLCNTNDEWCATNPIASDSTMARIRRKASGLSDPNSHMRPGITRRPTARTPTYVVYAHD